VSTTPAIDEAKLEAFMGLAVTDMGAAISAVMNRIGERCGLYKAMAHAGPLTSQQVAERAGCDERYVREWLSNQAAGGYVEYDAGTGMFTLPEEQALALAEEDSPALPHGRLRPPGLRMGRRGESSVDMFKTGKGVGWHEHDHRLYSGTERFFRPGYQAHLVAEWIPALDGVEEKLKAGARVADVGCGHGASTAIMAAAYPASRFTGIDYHDASIERARQVAAEEGVAERSASSWSAPRRDSRAAVSTSSATSTACTTWATPSAPRVTRARRWRATGPTWSSSRTRATRWRTNLNPVGRMF